MDASSRQTSLATSGGGIKLWHVLVVAAVVRGAVLVALFGQFESDPDAYLQIAENLRQHGSYALSMPQEYVDRNPEAPTHRPTAYRPPLYPVLIALIHVSSANASAVRIAALHWVLGVATAGLTFVIGRRLNLGFGAAVAALLVTCDPILLNQSALIMTETLATFLAVAVLFTWQRFGDRPNILSAAVVGVTLGVAALCRPTFLPWLALLVFALLVMPRSMSEWGVKAALQARLMFALAIVLAATVVISPWVVRNAIVIGRPIATTTHGGYTILLGNNPAYYQNLRTDNHTLPWAADDPAFQELLPKPAPPQANELVYDRATKRLAFESIAADPLLFLQASLGRVAQLWSPLPNRTSLTESTARRLLRYATAAWYVAVFALAIVGAVRLKRRLLESTWLAGLLLCAAFTLMHSVYWSNLRMRGPLMPVVALLAGAAVAPLAPRLKLPVEPADERVSTA